MSINPASREAAAQDPVQQEDPVLTLFAKTKSAPQDVLSISSLSLTHFRNYASAHIEVTPAPVVLTGRNGAGKTNILEAISLLTPGRGIRRARLSEMDSQFPLSRESGGGSGRGNPWVISAHVSGIQGDVHIGTGREENSPLPNPPPFEERGSVPPSPAQRGRVGEGEKRIVKIDGKVSRSQAELARHMAMIWLTPQMEQLFNDGASAGRKFLDRLVYSFDAEHASRINEYEYAMRERNKLLAEGRGDAAWFEALEATMAETGAAIAAARLIACDHINHTISSSGLSFPKAILGIHGLVEDGLKEGGAAVMVEESFKKALHEGRGRDAAAGRALAGTHRSELKVIHAAKTMPAEHCSTGEQKALLLSIVLAQARAGGEWHGVVPVLLLDEISAHLDAIRRLELFEEIARLKSQVWMTGTDPLLFEGIQGKATFLRVENGAIFPV